MTQSKRTSWIDVLAVALLAVMFMAGLLMQAGHEVDKSSVAVPFATDSVSWSAGW